MRDTSIILVNYNGKKFIKDCLDSLMASDASQEEIILVDNGSTDGSCEEVRQNFSSVRVIRLEKNYGFSVANNRGARESKNEYLVFLNNDTVVPEKWLSPLLTNMKENPQVGVVGSKLLLYSSPRKINSAGANILFNGGGYEVGFLDDDGEKYNTPSFKGSVCAACMMVRKNEFLSLGGFDPDYFLYFEDVDICWRYWLSGYKVMYLPSSSVLHRYGATSGADTSSPLRIFYGTRNSLYNVIKNLESNNLLWAVVFNLVHHFTKFLVFLGFLKFKKAGAILSAYGSLLDSLPQTMKKRRKIQKIRKVNDKYLFENGLIMPFSYAVREYFRLRDLFEKT